MKAKATKGSGGGQNGIEDPINYGTFSTQKYEVRQVYQHTKGGGFRPSCDAQGLLVVYIGESGHGVSSESMFTWEVPCNLTFQACGTTLLADLGGMFARRAPGALLFY